MWCSISTLTASGKAVMTTEEQFCPVGDSDQFGPADNKPQQTNQDPAVHTCTWVSELTAGTSSFLISSTARFILISALCCESSTTTNTCNSSFKCSQFGFPFICSSCKYGKTHVSTLRAALIFLQRLHHNIQHVVATSCRPSEKNRTSIQEFFSRSEAKQDWMPLGFLLINSLEKSTLLEALFLKSGPITMVDEVIYETVCNSLEVQAGWIFCTPSHCN